LKNKRPLAASAGAVVLTLALAAAGIGSLAAFPTKYVHLDGSRTPAVHIIPLLDERGDKIRPDDNPAMPFSPRATCGDCHEYDAISTGWHFNASKDVTQPGRPGEPWVVIDAETGTQIPISYRDWPGAWRPEDLGMSAWDFTKTFGRHLPGGGVGEGGRLMDYGYTQKPAEEAPAVDPESRWEISGELEVNCLACHNAGREQNQGEWVFQVMRENFRWAATGASMLGVVRNVASRLPESYDYINGRNPDDAWAVPPNVLYNPAHFDCKERIFFDVTRDPPARRCYFCHSTVPADTDLSEGWMEDGDVHVAAAKFTCTDCHRNGLDHFMVRGYEGESTDPSVASLTCRGCHLQDDGGDDAGGRLTAPYPLHRGLPTIHIEKLACTTCHAGPMPTADIGRVKTSRANRLGIHGAASWSTELPYILSPVYIRQDDGKIGPHALMWPAFWGRIEGDEVKPLPVEVAAPYVGILREAKKFAAVDARWKQIEEDTADVELYFDTEAVKGEAVDAVKAAAAANEAATENTTAETVALARLANAVADDTIDKFNLFLAMQEEEEDEDLDGQDGSEAEAPEPESEPEPEPEPELDLEPLTDPEAAQVLANLAQKAAIQGEPVYVANGRLYRTSNGQTLTASEHAAARPYTWPIGHDVRPAAQSLGSGGCTDCHAPDAPFFFAAVKPDTPAQLAQAAAAAPMHEWQDLDLTTLKALDSAARFYTPYLVSLAVFGLILAAALVHFGFNGLESLLHTLVASAGKEG